MRQGGVDANWTRDYTEKGVRVAAPPTITDNHGITIQSRIP